MLRGAVRRASAPICRTSSGTSSARPVSLVDVVDRRDPAGLLREVVRIVCVPSRSDTYRTVVSSFGAK